MRYENLRSHSPILSTPDEYSLTLVEEPQTAGSDDDEMAKKEDEALSAVPGTQTAGSEDS